MEIKGVREYTRGKEKFAQVTVVNNTDRGRVSVTMHMTAKELELFKQACANELGQKFINERKVRKQTTTTNHPQVVTAGEKSKEGSNDQSDIV